ncbi:unnamed protein product [Sphagnum troendelagicum]|uniref:Uncharacterized protein n=1 Tax=Sphagnum troendelagicum TaxID=128251 RepID=A0ABP0T883_9BRYO
MSEERDTELASVGQKLAKAKAKEALMTLLPKAATMLEEVEQSPPSSTIYAMKACSDALVDPALLRHKDKDVGLLVALCISEIMRIVAPDAPYSDDCLKEIFQLIVDIFRELDDVDSPFFSSRVNILETVAKVRSCVVMLDLECDDLITEMFRIFFTTASDKHPEHVFLAMRNVLSLVIEEGEEVSSQILEIILNNLLRQKEGVSEAGHKLAVAVVENSADNLEPYVRSFLTLVILEGRGLQTGLKKDYHEIIYEIYSCAPQMLLAVLPYLKEELVSNQVTVRLKATMLLGRMFALPDRHVANGYQQLFSEFLKRLNDEDADVQIAAINCAKACLETMNSSAVETSEILDALGDQLLHFDDGVRISVMNIICDFARANLNFNPPGILQKVGDCLQDTKTSIGIETLLKLASVYRSYCTKSFKGFKAVHDEFEWIPSKILCCCYRKGSADDFKLLDPEIAIFEELFDADLPVEEQAKHWITFFSLFDEQDKIALQHILSHKQRLQLEMVVYLSELWTAKEKDTPDFQKRLQSTFATIAQQFADPKKAEEDLKKLHNMSDVTVFKELSSLLDPSTTTAHAHTVCAELLKKIGEDHPQHNFLKTLATKCAYSVFSREHAHAFLQEILINKDSATKEQTISTLDLLGEVAAYCPTLMEDLKEKLELLAKDDKEFIRKGVFKIISNKAGSSFHEGMAGSEVSRDKRLVMEKFCLKMKRKQTKTTGKVIGPKKMSVAVGMEHGEMEEVKNLPPRLECGQPEGSSNKKDGSDDVLEEAEKDGVEEHEEEHHHVKNPEEDGMNNNNHEKDDTVKDVEDVMNAGKQDHELNDLQVRVKEKVQDIKEDGAEVQHNVVAISKDSENEEAKIDEKDAAKDGMQDKEDEIEAHVVDKVEDPEEQEVRDHEKDDGVVQQQREEKRQVTTGHEVEGEERREPAKDGTGDHAGDKSEDNMENATNHNSDHGSKHSEGDVVKDSVEDERSNEEDGLQVQDGGPVKDPHKGEIEEKPAGLDLDLDHKEDGKTFDGSQKENDAGDSKDTDDQEGNVKDDHKEVTVEDDNKEVTVVEGTTNKGGLGDLQVADEANSHEDEKGLSRKEEDAGVDHEDGSEGHKQERVDDQAEEETKGEIGVKGSKEDSKDGQEDDEPGKETMENDREDHDEHLPAKRTRLPEGSSKNHHVRDLSSEDKKDEEEGGEDDQDVDQTPQQSDEKEHEKDLVENLSTKRKPGQGSKRKLPVGDGRAHRSREENVDPKRKRGLPENSIKKGEVLDEDVNNDGNQQELDVSTPKSKHKLPKNSVDKGIEYVLNGHDKDGDMDTEENLTPKSKAGHAKASGKKESRRVSSGKGGKQEEKEEGGDQTPKHKAGRPKGGSGGKEITYPSADRGGDEGLVGCGIKVWWPLDRRFYKGEVVSYNAKKKKHKVLYDDGEEEILDLVQERWELITKKQRPVKVSCSWKKQSLSKSGKKGVSKEGKPNNLEAKFLEAKSPVNTISAFDFDEDDDGEAPRGGKTKRKPTQSSSTPKGSSGKIFKLVSSTKPSAKDDSSDTLGDGEPLNTWVIQRQKAH